MYPDIALALARTRSNDLIKQAEQHRLVAQARRANKASGMDAQSQDGRAPSLAPQRHEPHAGHWLRSLRHRHGTA